MKTHPSSENPNAAPDKSHQATEKIQHTVQISNYAFQLLLRILKDSNSNVCKSMTAEILQNTMA